MSSVEMVEQPENDLSQHVVARSSHTFAVLNRYPYTYGHVMIVPYAHLSSPEDMTMDALTDLMLMTNRTMAVLRHIADPPAFNIGANIGSAAGAGIAGHYHFHIVPRWPTDHSFLECIGGTRAIPDTLDNMLVEMRAAWEKLYGGHQDAGV